MVLLLFYRSCSFVALVLVSDLVVVVSPFRLFGPGSLCSRNRRNHNINNHCRFLCHHGTKRSQSHRVQRNGRNLFSSENNRIRGTKYSSSSLAASVLDLFRVLEEEEEAANNNNKNQKNLYAIENSQFRSSRIIDEYDDNDIEEEEDIESKNEEEIDDDNDDDDDEYVVSDAEALLACWSFLKRRKRLGKWTEYEERQAQKAVSRNYFLMDEEVRDELLHEILHDDDDDDDDDDDEEDLPKKKKRKKKPVAEPVTPAPISKKPKKDPNKPKRAQTAFMIFSNENRERFKKENPELKFGDLAKLIGAEYKALGKEDLAGLELKVGKEKERYEREMKKYTPSAGFEESETKGKGKAKTKKKKKDPNAPKRATTAFMFYSSKMRPIIKEELPDTKFTEMGKLIGEKWRELSSEDKKEFEAMADEDKERYSKQLAKYKAKKQDEEDGMDDDQDGNDSDDDSD